MSLRSAAVGLAVFAFATSAEAGAQQAPAAPACNVGNFVHEQAIATTLFASPLKTWNRRDLAMYGSGVINEVINYGTRNALPRMTQEANNMFDRIERDRDYGRQINWQNWHRRVHPVLDPVLTQVEENRITIPQARVRAMEISTDYVSRGLRILSDLPQRPGLCPVTQ